MQEYLSIISCSFFFGFIVTFYNWRPGRNWVKVITNYFIYTALFAAVFSYFFLIAYGMIMDHYILELIVLGASE